jgi:phenylalanyl-tRNA synthetase beta chain
MRVSLSWLRELLDLPETPEVIAERLTLAGFEVETLRRAGEHLTGVLAGEVLAAEPHPTRPELQLVSVGDGSTKHAVVCGAPNVPPPGGRVAFAPVGARIGQTDVGARKLGGVESHGVLCSETDLDVGVDAAGLLLLPDSARPGTDLRQVLGLDDVLLDIGVTPNRPDGLGHLGVARELGALFRRPVRLPAPPPFTRAPRELDVAVRIDDPAGCPRYGAQVVRELQVRPSPWNLRYRLHLLGVRAVSNLVDVTNLVLLLFAQPLHAFDLLRLRGPAVVVRRARPGEKMWTLDGLERTFEPADLLICDAERPVAVAGVMGGLDSEIRDDTRDVLIECAHFDPPSIRRTSKRLGLASESSYRFERGTDRGGVPHALAYAAGLMAQLGQGRVCGDAIDAGGPGPDPQPLRLRPARLARIVGREYSRDEVAGTLERLGCRVKTAPDGAAEVVVPTWRPDLTREIDLIEEVARVVGYGEVPGTPPVLAASLRAPGNWERLAPLRRLLVARGLAETVNLVFEDLSTLQAFGAADDACVKLRNPLDAGRAWLRTTLLPALLRDVRTAFAHRAPGAALFEIGKTFLARPGQPPEEVWRLGAALAGQRLEWLAGNAPSWDLYDAAALVAAAADGVFHRPYALRPDAKALPWCHPRTACVVELDGQGVGFVGELHPQLADRLDVPRGVHLLELDLRPERFDTAPVRARDLPRFPAVRRDVAAVFDEAVTAGAVVAAARELGPDFLEDAAVFDVYRGSSIPAGRKSMAFTLSYRRTDRTLTDAEVDEAHGRVVDGLVARFGVTIRR